MLGHNSETQSLSTVEQFTWNQLPMIPPNNEFLCADAEETASPNVQIYEKVQCVLVNSYKRKALFAYI